MVATQLTASLFRATSRQLSIRWRSFGTFTSSVPLKEKITIKVPNMGDSITEGTIVEWAADIGQAVKEDDVIVLVETDKVTIDIKAELDGVIVKHFSEVDMNVEVGSDLYEIDTEGVAKSPSSAEKTTETSISDSLGTDPPQSIPSSTDETPGHARIPSIKFLNKDGWNLRKNGLEQSGDTPVVDAAPFDPKAVVTLDSSGIGPTYGRPPFSEREIEALSLGGASEAPVMDEW